MSKHSIFEHSTCGKCGGDGLYHAPSGCGRHCFKCGGKGYIHSARGAEASAFLYHLLTKPASEVKVGDVYFQQGFSAGSFSEPNRWIVVDSIKHSTNEGCGFSGSGIDPMGPRLVLIGHDKHRNDGQYDYAVFPNTELRIAHTNDEKRAKQMLALAYQSFLNKNGTPNIKAILSDTPVDPTLAVPYREHHEV